MPDLIRVFTLTVKSINKASDFRNRRLTSFPVAWIENVLHWNSHLNADTSATQHSD